MQILISICMKNAWKILIFQQIAWKLLKFPYFFMKNAEIFWILHEKCWFFLNSSWKMLKFPEFCTKNTEIFTKNAGFSEIVRKKSWNLHWNTEICFFSWKLKENTEILWLFHSKCNFSIYFEIKIWLKKFLIKLNY